MPLGSRIWSRLWDRRSEVYAEILVQLRRRDIQEWHFRGSTSWESFFTSDSYGRVVAYSSEAVRSAYLRSVTATIDQERKAAPKDLERAIIADLQSRD